MNYPCYAVGMKALLFYNLFFILPLAIIYAVPSLAGLVMGVATATGLLILAAKSFS